MTRATPFVLDVVPASVRVDTPVGAVGVVVAVVAVPSVDVVVVVGVGVTDGTAAVASTGAVIWMLVRNESVGRTRAKSFSALSQFIRVLVSAWASVSRPETAACAARIAST
jgi:hypothetical protein